ncbi:MAG: 5-methyltetrahydropteroyltriglutamate--homocysteine S-methyltransferase [Acetobacteraceae bacterium]
MSVLVATLGFPRIGPRRELKSALERYWSGKIDAETLLSEVRHLRRERWDRQRRAGASVLPSNDFSLYDHVLDTQAMVGAIPASYGWNGGTVSLESYFAMARGSQQSGATALEMTKWFDTNYHYMVPEFAPGQSFTLASTKPVDEFSEARALGYATRPVLLGPVSFLLAGKSRDVRFDPLTLLPGLLPVYAEVLHRLRAVGALWVQMDEPALVTDLDERQRAALKASYATLGRAEPGVKLLLATYFGPLGDNLEAALALDVAGLHLDLGAGGDQLPSVLARAPAELVLSLGVIDGRNVWRADLPALLDSLEPVVERRGPDRVILAPTCSLLHVPVDLEQEQALDPALKSRLAFAVQKIEELALLAHALNEGRSAIAATLQASSEAAAARTAAAGTAGASAGGKRAAITPDMARRRSSFAERSKLQHRRLALPPFPTTTIGSFPQTAEIRKARAAHAHGTLGDAGYQDFLREETKAALAWQEAAGLDVLVHGEFERNDMVQYFAEQLSGFAATTHGWVQSYGSRCVRPPIIAGDVARPRPMTLDWSRYAQSLTSRPVKGMLTGPVTMLQWSFVRADQPRADTCREIALALREEVIDLEKAGIRIIQIDEPALREGLPLRKADRRAYLEWAVECFRLAASGVADETQIHTHMCYSEFNDIIDAIAAMDADVISIESARSKMELLDAFTARRYPNEIGPGVYDIHSTRVPSAAEMADLLRKASHRLRSDQLWVNPDCGLKTRRWEEIRPALTHMVEAAKEMRAELKSP